MAKVDLDDMLKKKLALLDDSIGTDEEDDDYVSIAYGASNITRTQSREGLEVLEDKLEQCKLDTSTRTREKLEEAEAQLVHGQSSVETSIRTRERLCQAEAELERRRTSNEATSTRTRERLHQAEAELKRRQTSNEVTSGRTRDKLGTSTRTRERLAEVEVQLAHKRSMIETSTRTRERLRQAEAELERRRSSTEETSSRTRERLAKVKAQLAETSSKTRGKLALAEDELERRRKAFAMEIFVKKQVLLQKMVDENKNVDIAFLVDSTGSMASYIQEAKNSIQNVVNEIIGMFENKVRIAFVGYRDHTDGPKRIESLGFTEDTNVFKQFANNIIPTGGGDLPEDVLGGLEAVISLAWSSANKVVFHIGDSPQHGERFHDFGPAFDTYYNHEPRGMQAKDLIKTMKQMGLKYFFGKINNSTDKMIQEFQRIGGVNFVQEVKMKGPDVLHMLVAESVTSTIEATISNTVSFIRSVRHLDGKTNLSSITEESEGGKTLKDYSIIDVEPVYEEFQVKTKVHWLTCNIPEISNLSEIRNHIGSIDHKWTTMMVKKASDPFAEGEQRISIHGLRMEYTEGKENEKIVLKEFKHFGSGRDRREDYIEIMETQAVAAFMANEFNKIVDGQKKILFLAVSVAQMFKDDGAAIYYNVEKLLPDYKQNFKKWNTNAGHVNKESAVLSAFSHWTYDVTGGFLVVCDLQGVERGDMFILTDPSINCKEPRFGHTNLGDVGIKLFFGSHKCGDVCISIGLKRNKYMKTGLFDFIKPWK